MQISVIRSLLYFILAGVCEIGGGYLVIHPVGEVWRVGIVTSATFSPILNRSIALAQVVPEFAAIGMQLEV